MDFLSACFHSKLKNRNCSHRGIWPVALAPFMKVVTWFYSKTQLLCWRVKWKLFINVNRIHVSDTSFALSLKGYGRTYTIRCSRRLFKYAMPHALESWDLFVILRMISCYYIHCMFHFPHRTFFRFRIWLILLLHTKLPSLSIFLQFLQIHLIPRPISRSTFIILIWINGYNFQSNPKIPQSSKMPDKTKILKKVMLIILFSWVDDASLLKYFQFLNCIQL